MAVSQDYDLNEPIDNDGNTLIHYVVQHGQLEDIDFMLFTLSGSAIDTPNQHGHTALIRSIIAGKQNVTSLLLHHGADPTLRDKNGQSPFDHNQQREKPLVLVPQTLIPLLPSIWLHLEKLRSPNDMRVFLAWLAENNYALDKIINHTDCSILYFIMHLASLRSIKLLLPLIPNNMLTITNCRGQSILHSLLHNNRHVNASVLIHRLSEFMPKRRQPYSLRNGIIVHGRSIDDYLQVHELLANMTQRFNIDESLSQIEELGFQLDDPMNELDDTALHYLVDFLPVDALQRILKSKPTLNLTVRNVHHDNLFDQAASSNRFSMMKFLSDKCLSCDFSALSEEDVQQYQAYCERKNSRSTYAYLHRLFNEVKKIKPIEQECVIACFNLFVDYLKKNHFQYNGCDRTGEHFLDEPAGTGFTVNCVDLAMAFGHLLDSIGIKDLYIHRYAHIKSRRFSDKGKIQGDFVCFDSGYQDRKSAAKRSFAFDMHMVLRVGAHLYDPTFSCHYAHPEDLHYPRHPSRRLHVIEAVVTNRITSEPANYRRFKLQFLAKLHGILPPEKSQYEFYGNSLRISRGYTTINISDEASTMHITAQHYSTQRIAEIIEAWALCNKAAHFKVQVGGTHKAEIDKLKQHFTLDCPPTARRLLD